MKRPAAVRFIVRRTYESIPPLRPLMDKVSEKLHPPWFSGWGMTTHHAAPWSGPDWTHFEVAARAARTTFEHGLKEETGVTSETVDDLRWRHWNASFCARYACSFARDQPVALVECGVGDGLTAFFACHEADHLGADYAMHCYDTWARVATDRADVSYSELSIDRTRRNLSGFSGRVTYHQGLIPSTFDDTAPASVAYLSIDLNSAQPTLDTLEFFLPRLAPRAVVLFDDYGYSGYGETKEAVDKFFLGRDGVLQKLPTGQAIWFS